MSFFDPLLLYVPNLDVILLVVAVVSFVLLLVFFATYSLNKIVDRSAD